MLTLECISSQDFLSSSTTAPWKKMSDDNGEHTCVVENWGYKKTQVRSLVSFMQMCFLVINTTLFYLACQIGVLQRPRRKRKLPRKDHQVIPIILVHLSWIITALPVICPWGYVSITCLAGFISWHCVLTTYSVCLLTEIHSSWCKLRVNFPSRSDKQPKKRLFYRNRYQCWIVPLVLVVTSSINITFTKVHLSTFSSLEEMYFTTLYILFFSTTFE